MIRSRNPLARLIVAFAALTALLLCCRPAAAIEVRKISWDSKVVYTRFVMEFDQAVKFNSVDSVKEKGFFYVDLYGISSNYRRKVLDVGDNVIGNVDAQSYPDHGVLRLVFYLKSRNSTFKVTQVENPHRLVVDTVAAGDAGGDNKGPELMPASAPTPATGSASVSLVPSGTSAQQEVTAKNVETGALSVPAIPAPKSRVMSRSGTGGREKIVIIDAGHGGSNRGTQSSTAVNGRTILEKELTLQFATYLKKVIDETPGMKAVMTRTGDESLSLSDRIKFAESRQGDLFVSIHMNDGAGNPNARGVEVFFLNERGTGDAAAKAVQERENIEVGDQEFFKRGKGPLLKTILTDLEKQNLETLQYESYVVCQQIMDAFQEIPLYRAHNRGIKSANFMVLKNFEMPAVLLEAGFLTNSQDTKYLVNPRFQHGVAMALANAISSYFAETDPEFRATRHDVSSAIGR